MKGTIDPRLPLLLAAHLLLTIIRGWPFGWLLVVGKKTSERGRGRGRAADVLWSLGRSDCVGGGGGNRKKRTSDGQNNTDGNARWMVELT